MFRILEACRSTHVVEFKKMADEEDLVEIDINEWKKFKVAELRQKMTEIGLETKGTKAELIARVERYLNEQEADLLDEEEDVGEEEEEEEEEEGDETVPPTEANETSKAANRSEQAKSTPAVPSAAVTGSQGVVKIEYQLPPPGQPIPTVTSDTNKTTDTLSDSDKLKKRGERFGVSDNLMSKKLSRAERFGTDVSTVLGKRPGENMSVDDMEKLKKRAQRFGSAGGSSMEDSEKKKSRASRFNLSAVDFAIEDRKANRAQRFGTTV